MKPMLRRLRRHSRTSTSLQASWCIAVAQAGVTTTPSAASATVPMVGTRSGTDSTTATWTPTTSPASTPTPLAESAWSNSGTTFIARTRRWRWRPSIPPTSASTSGLARAARFRSAWTTCRDWSSRLGCHRASCRLFDRRTTRSCGRGTCSTRITSPLFENWSRPLAVLLCPARPSPSVSSSRCTSGRRTSCARTSGSGVIPSPLSCASTGTLRTSGSTPCSLSATASTMPALKCSRPSMSSARASCRKMTLRASAPSSTPTLLLWLQA
mmetsp:Transcript_18118/g.42677  ORF Transcript_18118/g.42677 Transcript_18118/m.42677 type:complete len:269 (-) Transcript_18118:1494-2300(-)